jgi:hypothetical protein
MSGSSKSQKALSIREISPRAVNISFRRWKQVRWMRRPVSRQSRTLSNLWRRATEFKRRSQDLILRGSKLAHLLSEFRCFHVFIASASNEGIREPDFKFPVLGRLTINSYGCEAKFVAFVLHGFVGDRANCMLVGVLGCSIHLGRWVWIRESGPFTFTNFFVSVLSPAIHQRKCSLDRPRDPCRAGCSNSDLISR